MESKIKHLKLCKAKFDHSKYFKKWFWSYTNQIQLQIQMFCGVWKWYFSLFCELLSDDVSRKAKQCFRNISYKVIFVRSFLKNGFQLLFNLLVWYFKGFECSILILSCGQSNDDVSVCKYVKGSRETRRKFWQTNSERRDVLSNILKRTLKVHSQVWDSFWQLKIL